MAALSINLILVFPLLFTPFYNNYNILELFTSYYIKVYNHLGIKNHIMLNLPVILSTLLSSSGPIAQHVIVPGSTTVWPASVMIAVVNPASFASWMYK